MQVQGIRDILVQPLYDTMNLLAAGSVQLTFFQIPVGGVVPAGTTALGGGGAKTLSDTNMDLAGQLPAGFAFQLNGFRLAFTWNVPPPDVRIGINTAVFRFTVGQKDFLRVPARSLPSGNGPVVTGSPTLAATAVVATSGWPHMANNFGIKGKPLILQNTENFAAFLQWPAVQAISAATFITIYLDGYYGRPVQ
jgi:hypothetical protein